MNPEKWEQIKGNVLDNMEVEESDRYTVEDEGGAQIEYIVFASPLGRTKLEFVSKPLILDKKTLYSNRIGSETKVEYVYSDTEKTHKLNVYKWDEDQGDWQEIDAKNFSL
jgi:hypothetical protein